MVVAVATTNSGDPAIDAVVGNTKWLLDAALTFGFPTLDLGYGISYGQGETMNGFAGLTAFQANAARAAIANFGQVASITFLELPSLTAATATIRLAMTDAHDTALAYFPSTHPAGGDVWFNRSSHAYDSPVRGNYAYQTFLHEIGHAVGLSHPHEGGMPLAWDSIEFSVMSYRSYVGGPASAYTAGQWDFPQTLMMYDIAGVQHMYGANFSTNSGNTTYSFDPSTGQAYVNGVAQAASGGSRIFQTIWDGGGADTYDFSNYATSLSVDLRPGAWSTLSTSQLARLSLDGSILAHGNIANALQYRGDARSLIENGIGGSGNDSLNGNQASNSLAGGAGNDTLIGWGGNDFMAGGLGDDIYSIQQGGDIVSELAGQGFDLVYCEVNGQTLANNAEGFFLVGGALVGTGNLGDNYMFGSVLNNTINGGLGNDYLAGGAGDDIYVVNLGYDWVQELLGEGIDQVQALDSFALGPNIEVLFLFGSGWLGVGNDIANWIYGNAVNNDLRGGGGADTLYGYNGNDKLDGGADGDVLFGGSGADTFVLQRGQTQGDIVADFSRTTGDVLMLAGWGAGASLTNLGGGAWRISGSLGTETFTLSGITALDASDFYFT